MLSDEKWMVLADPRWAGSIESSSARADTAGSTTALATSLRLKGHSGKNWPAQMRSWLAELTPIRRQPVSGIEVAAKTKGTP
jgi:ABC-type Fe3+ transport system substrate-binding protein